MKPLKKILLLSTILVSITVVSLLVLTRIINPALIQDYVNTQLTTLTGQSSQIKGEIHWQLLPQPGIHLTHVMVGTTKGPYTIKLNNLLFNLNIKPLFQGKLVFSEVKVDGFEMNIVAKKDSQIKPAHQNEKLREPIPLDEKFAVEHFLLSHGTINYLNQDQKITIKKLQIGTEQLNIDQQEFPLQLKADVEFSNNSTSLKTHSSFKGTLTLSRQLLANPLSDLSLLKVNGQLSMQDLSINKIMIHRLGGKLSLNKGILSMNPLTLGLYQGEAVGDFIYSFANNKLQLNQTGTGLQTTRLMKDLFNTTPFQGTMDFSLHTDLNFSHKNLHEILGRGSLAIHDGYLDAINLNRVIEFTSDKLDQYLKGEKFNFAEIFTREQLEKANAFKGSTPIRLATLQYQFSNSKISAKSLVLQTDNLHLQGEGEFSLTDYAINSVLSATVATNNEQFKQIQNTLGGAFPLIVKGTLSEPIIFPDTKNFSASLTKQWVSETFSKPVKTIKHYLNSPLGTS